MRKTLLVLSTFAVLTFSLTQTALAEWKANRITNRTTENIYVIYSTWRGAQDAFPRGYRTRGYYRVSPGQQRSFYAWSNNSIYFRISQSGEAIKPQSATTTFAFWIHSSRAFTVVSSKLDASVTRGQLTYSSLGRDTLSQEDGFMKYSNGSTLTVTSGWVAVVDELTPPEAAGADEGGEDVGGGTVPTDMVLIPAGEFRMGSNSGQNNEKPVHSVYLDAFYMDKYEVTNAEYAVFLNAKGKHSEGGQIWLDIGDGDERIEFVAGAYRAKVGYENHPVVEVSWYGAMAYSKWKGKRLPTEAEWEKAARGSLSGLTYPWGNTIDSTKANYNRDINDTTAVGKYTANGYGLYDVCGNVWEWCLDEWNSGFYAVSPARNPLSGANSIQWILDNYTGVRSSRVLRGGSWTDPAHFVRVALRDYSPPTPTFNNYGFRCARSVSP